MSIKERRIYKAKWQNEWVKRNPEESKRRCKKYRETHKTKVAETLAKWHKKNAKEQAKKSFMYRRTPKGWAFCSLNKMRRRCKKVKSYVANGIQCHLTKGDFLPWVESQWHIIKPMLDKYDKTQNMKHTASIDRIDNLGDYTLDNIQILSVSDNSRKQNK